MAGYHPGEFANSLEAFKKRVHPEDVHNVMDTAEKYLSGQRSEFHVEFRFKHKNDSWIWIEGKGKIFEYGEDGQPTRFIGTHTDITERKRAEDDLRQLKDDLQAEVAQKTLELKERVENLERFYDATIEREFRMKELRDEIARLKGERG